ncbi:MAG: hypothetical protein SOH95_02620 [Bifidobacterium crudilactis]|jgi:hypothetical protein
MRAATRATDPDTSFEAAASVNMPRQRVHVLIALLCATGNTPTATYEQIIASARRCGFKDSESGLRSRCKDLVADGYVRVADHNGINHDGRRVQRFQPTWKTHQMFQNLGKAA